MDWAGRHVEQGLEVDCGAFVRRQRSAGDSLPMTRLFLNAMFVSADAADLKTEAHWIDRDDGDRARAYHDAPVTMKAYDNAEKAKQHLATAKKTCWKRSG